MVWQKLYKINEDNNHISNPSYWNSFCCSFKEKAVHGKAPNCVKRRLEYRPTATAAIRFLAPPCVVCAWVNFSKEWINES
ncbi:hypothetical protein ACROYT_G001588 [Oculina patagonica]